LNRRQFLKEAAASSLLVSGLVHSQAQGRDRPPNVLLIMTDDQGWGDVRSHGNDQIDTPVLDRLASEGARFDRFFVSPACAPTRAGLLTGRYYLRTGVQGVSRSYETMREAEVTLAEALKQAGYATGCFGKWHNGSHYPHHPLGRGFDEFFGFCHGHLSNYFDTTVEHNGRPVKTEGFITDVLNAAALTFIERHRDEPFFCYVPYNAPHSPFQVPDRYFDKYKARGCDDRLASIYGMCENIDDNVGRLLHLLDQLGLTDNTLVIFLTDNGPNSDRYNGGMKGRKSSIDEGGVRVPLFVRLPGRIKPGTEVAPIAADIDLFPTIMELCGLSMSGMPPQDGKSLVPLLRGSPDAWPDRMLFTFGLPMGDTRNIRGSVRTTQWRAVGRGERWELYDMIRDPNQQTDVAEDHPKVVTRLSDAFRVMVEDVSNDGFDLIPTHVGYADWPKVALPAHEGFLEPAPGRGIEYRGKAGWAHDWITKWTDTKSFAWWPLRIVRPGSYKISVLYGCSEEELGARLRVEICGKSLERVVQEAHTPDVVPSPDRVPRNEIYELIWASLPMGALKLQAGDTRVVLRAPEIPGGQACDIKAVVLERLD
jgi:arylsulfatase A-like enzyme